MGTSTSPINTLPYGVDPGPLIADLLTERYKSQLPDLNKATILVPNPGACGYLYRALAASSSRLGFDAVLGPTITSFRAWVEHTVPDHQAVATQNISELLLVEALRNHLDLFGEQDPWRLADSLLPLFNELSLNQITIPEDQGAFVRILQSAYGTGDHAPRILSREAEIVTQLWRAWREQLAAEGFTDPSSEYLAKLEQLPDCLDENEHIVLVEFEQSTTRELSLIRTLIHRQQLSLFLLGKPGPAGIHPDAVTSRLLAQLDIPSTNTASGSEYDLFLQQVFPDTTSDITLKQRAEHTLQTIPESPTVDRLRIFSANSAEEEAHAIDITIRQWLLSDIQPIAVVTNDRKLARRLRALLEQAGISLQDMGGWALSTTAAATAVERWLQTVEEDFEHRPLLDLLKSPFFCKEEDRPAHLHAVYRFEQDIILHENIPRGMERYRRHLNYRSKRLSNWPSQAPQEIKQLLDLLETAAAPLLELQQGTHPAREFLANLRKSMEILGLWDSLEADLAGQQLLQQWNSLAASVRQRPIKFSWLDFRIWLARCLETNNFKPSQSAQPVQLLTLEQSRLIRPGGIIIAACDQGHLPGPGPSSPFFNNRARAELGLSTTTELVQHQLHNFRSAIDCAPMTLLSWRKMENGEPNPASPWLVAVRTFHTLAYGDDLEDRQLHALLAHPDSRVRSPDSATLPLPSTYPAPVLPAQLRPQKMSASSHQRLIDCPYRFFAADGLGLKAAEEIKAMLEKSDYGERVHRCLEAFHSDVRHVPGPFLQPLSLTTRAQAIALLLEISHAVFSRDLEDNFMHRGWLKRWEDMIPRYIDWQITRQEHWQVHETERNKETIINDGLQLGGRLDRVDSAKGHYAIIDYKTGRIPKQEDILQGEAVQLPTYALLHEAPVQKVEYLQLDQRKCTSVSIEEEQLVTLQDAVQERLLTVTSSIDAGTPLPAWGDQTVCMHCEMDGLCRCGAWIDKLEQDR